MKIKLTAPIAEIKSFVSLPSSKSISNRALIIQALCDAKIKLKNLSSSKDTEALISTLKNISRSSIDIGAAGTAMRFLCAFFAMTPGERILTGSPRMQQRPIQALVNILRELGADIDYLNQEGYPPIKITGNKLIAKAIHIKGNISSQYISALLMIAPYLKGEFVLTIEDKILSKDYIWMTIKLMEKFGISIQWIDNRISIRKGEYQSDKLIVESDWSSASYWFELISLNEHSMIELTGLNKNSLQGDSVLTELFKTLGVDSAFTNFGLRIKNIPTSCPYFEYDFSDCPDLAQTLAVTLVAKNIPFTLNGLDNLSIKETDRIKALVVEFQKLGIHFQAEAKHTLSWEGNEFIQVPKNHVIETYNDHRMALAFAPLSLVTQEIIIRDPDVVVKSYPNYWKDLEEVGFRLNYL